MAHINAANSTGDQPANTGTDHEQINRQVRADQSNDQCSPDFTAETECGEADYEFSDRIYLQLDPNSFDQFRALLDNPPAPAEALRRLLLTEAPWSNDDDAGHLNE